MAGFSHDMTSGVHAFLVCACSRVFIEGRVSPCFAICVQIWSCQRFCFAHVKSFPCPSYLFFDQFSLKPFNVFAFFCCKRMYVCIMCYVCYELCTYVYMCFPSPRGILRKRSRSLLVYKRSCSPDAGRGHVRQLRSQNNTHNKL